VRAGDSCPPNRDQAFDEEYYRGYSDGKPRYEEQTFLWNEEALSFLVEVLTIDKPAKEGKRSLRGHQRLIRDPNGKSI
jgi:hypothetical protein